jgi:L-threonylcarbamoyladenylate synthase
MDRIRVDALNPDPVLLARAADVIRAGGVVAVPTDTLYGLAADPFNPKAVDRIFAAKGRADAQAVALVAADEAQVVACLGALTAIGRKLAAQFWPGPLTILMTAADALAPNVSAGTGMVGVRVPDHRVARELCRLASSPLVATSANRSGQPPTRDADQVAAALGGSIDLLVDSGPTPGGAPSTIVDTSGEAPRLVREGAIDWERIERCLHE